MGLEIVTDELIEKLLRANKTVLNPSAKNKIDSGHEKNNFNITDDEDNKFVLYVRQNMQQGMEDDFSCGLIWTLPSGESLTLIRYNGASHAHTNRLEKTKLHLACHIHKATQRYLDHVGKADGYAEETDRYNTAFDALRCLTEDCNISGLSFLTDQQTLFKV